MSLLTLPSEVVSVAWLARHINHPSLLLLDASYFMKALKRDGKSEWCEQTIPGAHFFDFDNLICDQASTLPHMMPSEKLFEQAVRSLGVNQDNVIVVFDRLGIFSSPRVWWMFKCMGFNNIAVLDGGLNSWKGAGLAVAKGELNRVCHEGDFCAQYQPHLIVDSAQVLVAMTDPKYQIVDARAENRFLAQVPESRAGLRSGHMPNAKNLPFNHLLIDGEMRDIEQLRALYQGLIDEKKHVIFSCGSGVTACVLALGATLCGYQHLAVYDGSWTQWGADEKLPVVQ
ncbi:MAG: 3-mercaptopyruvate sulfurtransferase [Psychromonas sp.]